ncbi:MAG: hypothetical protein EOP34_05330 [Rickettsiales bacterium]|nr:MAG: hypothetical protein EOP34_05330 [Rickettsiales bacterium]
MFIYSSLFSLIIGSILGLTQFRIKRLFAYSTISHVGFILLALAINSTESIQSYIFYILQYSISNLNAFIILVTMGFSFYLYVNKEESKEDLYNIVATEKNISSKNGNVTSSRSENKIGTSNVEKIKFTSSNIVISSSFSSIIAILTLLLLLFIYIPGE